jgi:hypothetical protein
MVCGQLPFIEKSREMLFQAIKQPKIYYPNDISIELIDFFQKIFEVNPKKRLGSKGAAELKNHPFFHNVNWDQIYLKNQLPPFKPRIFKKDDTRYIHQEFLDEVAIDSIKTIDYMNTLEDMFLGDSFDYINKGL